MTLAPLVNPTVHGVKGAPVELAGGCAAPGCGRAAQQRHHLWPKSFLRGQPYEWVSVNGVVIPNSIGLCLGHHAEVTGLIGGHVAKVVYHEGLQVFEWWEKDSDGDYRCLGLLDSEMVHRTEAEVTRTREGLCPTCGKPHNARKPTKPRKVKTWTVNVPDDAEDGAAVLDEYVDDLSITLGFGDESKGVRRYHVMANVLAWVMTVKTAFIADWEEAGE